MSARAVTLLARTQISRDTMALRFSKPEGFTFRAGQAIDLILPTSAGQDESAMRHAFSIVSAPHEPDPTIATRMRSTAYKRALAALAIGTQVGIDGPFGSLNYAGGRRPAVFVAGGIGITPFVSILRELDRTRGERSVTLLYSNRTPEDTAFLEELGQLARHARWFTFVPTITDAAADATWSGARGRLDEELFRQHVPNVRDPSYYVVGPPPMVEAVIGMLTALGIKGENIKTESFYGY